jgi:hypothetical protein
MADSDDRRESDRQRAGVPVIDHAPMDDRERLAFYPFVVVRIACRVCSRNGAYRLDFGWCGPAQTDT